MKKKRASGLNENVPSYLEENFFDAWKHHPGTKDIRIERERPFHSTLS